MNRSLRIAVIVGVFPEVSETFILRQITGLLDAGHEVDIYADTRGGMNSPLHPEIEKYRLLDRTTYLDMPPESAPWEMPVWPISGKTWLPGAEIPTANWRRLVRAMPPLLRCLVRAPRLTCEALSPAEHGYQAASLSALYRLEKLSRTAKTYDLIHAHFGPVGNSFRFTRKLWRAPFIVSFHGYDVSVTPKKSGAGVYRKLFAEADAVTANSDFMGAKLRELGCPAEKIHKLFYGIDVSSFSASERQPNANEPVRVLTVGRLTEKKGIEFAIRAMAAVRQTCPDTVLDIVGEGPLRLRLRELIAELGQSDAVFLHGSKNSNAIREMLGRAQIFMLPSVTAADGDREGTPVSLLEAQAAGLPVISTRHAGIPEIVLDGESGFLVPERDATALAERLSFLIQHPETRSAMGRKGRTSVEAHFSFSKCNEQLLQIYLEALKEWSR